MTTQTTAPVSMKLGPFLFLAILALSSLLTACSGGGGGSSTPPLEPVLAAPTFTPAAGTYLGPQSVSIADATASASIYYTLDGSSRRELVRRSSPTDPGVASWDPATSSVAVSPWPPP